MLNNIARENTSGNTEPVQEGDFRQKNVFPRKFLINQTMF